MGNKRPTWPPSDRTKKVIHSAFMRWKHALFLHDWHVDIKYVDADSQVRGIDGASGF